MDEEKQERREQVIDKYAEICVRVADNTRGKNAIERALSMRKTLARMVAEYLDDSAGAGTIKEGNQ